MDDQGPPTRLVRRPQVVVALVAVAAVVVILVGLRFTGPLLAPLFLAFMTAVVLMPVVTFLERRGLPTAAAVVGVLVIVLVCGGVFVFVAYVQLVALGEKLPEYGQLLTNASTRRSAATRASTRH